MAEIAGRRDWDGTVMQWTQKRCKVDVYTPKRFIKILIAGVEGQRDWGLAEIEGIVGD